MSTLVDTIQSMFTPQILGSMAVNTGVPETKIRAGMLASTRAIMDGLLGKANDSASMREVTHLLDSTPELDDPTNALDEDSPVRKSGSRLLGLVTNDVPGMIRRLAVALGIGGGVASTMLGTASGLVLAAFRKFGRTRGGLDSNTLSAVLLNERAGVNSSFPSYVAPPPARVETPVSQHRTIERPRRGGLWWLVALIPLALIALWLFNRSHRDERMAKTRRVERPEVVTPKYAPTKPMTPEPEATRPPATAEVKPTPAPEPPAAGTEPGATEPHATEPGAPPTADVTPPAPKSTPMAGIPAGSPEAALRSQAEAPAGTTNEPWIDLDQINFAVNSATVPANAQEQIKHVADIMQANTNVTIEIGGHASSTGNKQKNMELSKARAESVREALIGFGADASRIEVKGFADETKTVDTPKEEQANRRVSARVKSISRDEG